MKTNKVFAAVSVATVALPWVMLWAGRGRVLAALFCVGVVTLLLWTVLTKNGQLATWGALVLLILFLSVLIVPSLAK